MRCAISATGVFGADSYIIGTSDGGNSWHKLYIDTGNYGRIFPLLVGGVAYPSANLLIVTADSGFIHRSTDAGMTWEERRIITIPDGKAITAGQISMLDTLHGVLAWKVPRFDDNGVPEFLMTTSDGGLTWDTTETSPILPEWRTQQPVIDAVACVAPNHYVCVVTNYGVIFKIASTEDGGRTWHHADNPLAGESNVQFTRLEFPDARHGFLTGNDIKNSRKSFVALTRDSGRTWELLHHDRIDGALGGMYYSSFRDSLNGLGGGGGAVFRTSDGGRTWERDSLESIPSSTPVRVWTHWLTKERRMAAIDNSERFFLWDATSSVRHEWTAAELSVSVFPNPLTSDESLQVETTISKPGRLHLSLFSPLGVELLKEPEHPVEPGRYRTGIDLSYLPAGVYMLRVEFGDSEWTERVVLVR